MFGRMVRTAVTVLALCPPSARTGRRKCLKRPATTLARLPVGNTRKSSSSWRTSTWKTCISSGCGQAVDAPVNGFYWLDFPGLSMQTQAVATQAQ